MSIISIEREKILIVGGETGSGKTSFGIEIAIFKNGEIINIDLMQIYAPLKIGTGQILESDRYGVMHHCLGFLQEPVTLSVYDMREIVEKKILEVMSRGKLPILVGGSHFFILSLLFAPLNFILKEKERGEEFYSLFLEKKENREEISFENIVYPFSERVNKEKENIYFCPRFDYKIYFLNQEDKEIRENIIKKRILNFFSLGWIEEVNGLDVLWKEFVLKKKIIGYNEIIDCFSKEKIKNNIDFENLLFLIFIRTRQYTKKQRTFIRKLLKMLNMFSVCYEIKDANLFKKN